MSDILEKIAIYKREEVAARKASDGNLDARLKTASAPRGFMRALTRDQRPGHLSLIAE
ncbi:MAG TPA: indole-3-glycerol-phosphate synthase TrpC, partial [Asticcacaulis sp.]|nr:indole-3-glycerol-phosphate synthase TrpC [Asticcacaulis sp.]